MTLLTLKDKLINEISLIPNEKLVELYNFIHYFRLGTEKEKEKTKTNKDLLSYAGTWKDIDDEIFDNYLSDIANRRRKAFVSRRDNETIID